ncbi:hypothetical protein IAT38_001154 [Cryptococcus sp. DSM 104549]
MPRIAPTTLLRSATLARSSIPSRSFFRPLGPVSTPSPAASLARRYQSTAPEPPKTEKAQAGTSKSSAEFKTEAGGKENNSGIQVYWIFSAIAGLGALITIYGLLEFYTTLTTWPKAVRKPLRSALKSKRWQEYAKAEAFFREALQIALELGPGELEPEPLLKISGIYAELSVVLEIQQKPAEAFVELRKAVEMYGPNPLRAPSPAPVSPAPVAAAAPAVVSSEKTLGGGATSGEGEEAPRPKGAAWIGESYTYTDRDHERAIGLYQKLGQLALEVGSSDRYTPFPAATSEDGGVAALGWKTWDDAAEGYLSAALTAMLHLGLSSSKAAPTGNEGPVILGRDVNLPEGGTSDDPEEGGRVDKRGLGMTMESLSEVYARKGRHDMAGQLLLQATSLLLPPKSEVEPPMRDKCQAAMLMTTISSHALNPPTSKAIKVSRSWSLRSLQISQQALAQAEEAGTAKEDGPLAAANAVCLRAKAVALHNMGMLAEMEKDTAAAQNYFNKALVASRETGFSEGKREALVALRRLQNSTTNASS